MILMDCSRLLCSCVLFFLGDIFNRNSTLGSPRHNIHQLFCWRNGLNLLELVHGAKGAFGHYWTQDVIMIGIGWYWYAFDCTILKLLREALLHS